MGQESVAEVNLILEGGLDHDVLSTLLSTLGERSGKQVGVYSREKEKATRYEVKALPA